ncbi:hypothetical protein Q4575_04820 [Psychrosphaera sp. 1_MG-2023]|uniref:hypothetical protein n=1 Tax=Psychrosphaera sp. 1_MG-2023 TaxID=3062643 RepID=UPI0026E252CC|nr:hypothetical protein [Psychrosphaera sp. 1_MG-2023]MDO6718710.1 hypothetical protein [Psychrosphaera sp. 1_MG-2023]
MKYFIELHFKYNWNDIFIYLSLFVLVIGILLAVIEDSETGVWAAKLRTIRLRWLLPTYLIHFVIYLVSFYFAHGLKEQLPVYKYELTSAGCDVLQQAGLRPFEFTGSGCIVYGYSYANAKLPKVITIGSQQILLGEREIRAEHKRLFAEYRKEFDAAYESSYR